MISLLDVIVCILLVALLKPDHEYQKKKCEGKKVSGVLTAVLTSIIDPWGEIILFLKRYCYDPVGMGLKKLYSWEES